MDRIKSSKDISAHLTAVESLAPHDFSGAHQAIGRFMSQWPNKSGIYLQLQRLADFINKTRAELSSLRPEDVKRQFIPKATDELDAIVEATANATHSIMDAADVIMEAAGRMAKPDADKTMAAVTSIYEACTFQDITGQRVTKVVNMLKVIEERIDKMVAALTEGDAAIEADAAKPAPEAVAASQGDIDALFAAMGPLPKESGGSVLEGPALPGKGTSQADIDAILAGS